MIEMIDKYNNNNNSNKNDNNGYGKDHGPDMTVHEQQLYW